MLSHEVLAKPISDLTNRPHIVLGIVLRAACFTQEGVLRVGAGEPVVGRENLERFAAKWRANFHGAPRHLSWHVLLKPEDEDHVRGTASAALLATTEAGTLIVFCGQYEDRFERSADGEWLIAERFVTPDT